MKYVPSIAFDEMSGSAKGVTAAASRRSSILSANCTTFAVCMPKKMYMISVIFSLSGISSLRSSPEDDASIPHSPGFRRTACSDIPARLRRGVAKHEGLAPLTRDFSLGLRE